MAKRPVPVLPILSKFFVIMLEWNISLRIPVEEAM